MSYHPDVHPTIEEASLATAQVPMVNVFLLNAVKIPPRGSVYVQVKSLDANGPLMLEPDPSLQSKYGLHLPLLCSFP